MDDYFLFSMDKTKKKSTRRARRELTADLAREDDVDWLQQQVAKRRVKRDFENEFNPKLGKRRRRRDSNILYTSDLQPAFEPNDEWWAEQWYLVSNKMSN